MVVRFDVKGFNEPKVFTYLTSHQNDSKSFSEEYSKVTALNNGYFQFVYKKSHQVIFGLDKKEALQVETSSPLFTINRLDGCIVCDEAKGEIGKIYFSTQAEPLKEKSLDFYKNDPPWNGIDPFYSRVVMTQTPNNIISKNQPLGKPKD